MPRNEDVLPSLRPRSFPPLTWTTGGFRLGPVAGRGRRRRGGAASPARTASPATPATAPPSRAVVVPSIVRRFIWPNGCWVDSFIFALPFPEFCGRGRVVYRTAHVNTALPAEVLTWGHGVIRATERRAVELAGAVSAVTNSRDLGDRAVLQAGPVQRALDTMPRHAMSRVVRRWVAVGALACLALFACNRQPAATEAPGTHPEPAAPVTAMAAGPFADESRLPETAHQPRAADRRAGGAQVAVARPIRAAS